MNKLTKTEGNIELNLIIKRFVKRSNCHPKCFMMLYHISYYKQGYCCCCCDRGYFVSKNWIKLKLKLVHFEIYNSYKINYDFNSNFQMGNCILNK